MMMMIPPRRLIVVLTTLLAVAFLSDRSAHASASIVDLGPVDNLYGNVTRINNNGQVLGQTVGMYGRVQTFVWQPSDGTRQFITGYESRNVSGADINDAGAVVAVHSSTNFNNPIPFLWQNNVITNLPQSLQPRRLGNDGLILCRLPDEMGIYHPAVYDPTSGNADMLDNYLGYPSSASARNSSGTVVGTYVVTPYEQNYGLIWSNQEMISVEFTNDDTEFTTFFDINDNGLAIGYTGAEPAVRPFLWSREQGVFDLGFTPYTNPATITLALNNHDQAVGTIESRDGHQTRSPWLYENGTLTMLNDLLPRSSGWILQTATDINDAGQIIGIGTLDGERRAYLLQVPAPSALMAFAFALFKPQRRRR